MEMKKIIVSVLMPVLLLAVSCEKNQDFQTVIEAPATLVYVAQAGMDNVQNASVVVIPGDFITTEQRFQVNVNSNLHGAAQATLTVTPDEVTAYNQAKGTSYPVLPAENFSVGTYVRVQEAEVKAEGEEGEGEEEVDPDPFVPSTSATVNIPANERLSTEFIRLRLGGDLSALTEEYYMVALTLSCPGMELSKKRSVYYLKVSVTEKVIKPLDSVGDIEGSVLSTRTGWTATSSDGITNLGNMFTSSNTQGATFPSSDPLTFTVDMKAVHNVTGIKLLSMYASYGITDVIYHKLAYSVDGENFEEIEIDPETDVAMGSDYSENIGFYVPLQMQYVRMTVAIPVSSSSYASYRRLVQFYIYE